jgi:hypothetical protein
MTTRVFVSKFAKISGFSQGLRSSWFADSNLIEGGDDGSILEGGSRQSNLACHHFEAGDIHTSEEFAVDVEQQNGALTTQANLLKGIIKLDIFSLS